MPERAPFRLMVLSCSGGAGHVRAGEALHAWSRSFRGVEAVHHDVLDFTSKTFKRLYADSYLSMVQHARHVWGALYDHTETVVRPKSAFIRIFDHFNYRRYLKVLSDASPDAVVCTHFLPFLAIDSRILRGEVRPPFYAVGTDFNLHALWVSRAVRKYYVFSDETRWMLAARGVPNSAIAVSGIPVMPEFADRLSRPAARRTLGLPADRPVVLVLSGGYGVGRVGDIVEAAQAVLGALSPRNFSLVVVCGRNAALQRSLAKTPVPRNVHRTVAGFVTNMHQYMFAADIVVTKSGGLSSSEALACGRPMIVVDPIPGQERHNADVLLESGAASLAADPAQLAYKLQAALRRGGWRKRATAAAAALARPLAGPDIIADLLRDARRKPSHDTTQRR